MDHPAAWRRTGLHHHLLGRSCRRRGFERPQLLVLARDEIGAKFFAQIHRDGLLMVVVRDNSGGWQCREVVDDVSEPWESCELVDGSSAMRWATVPEVAVKMAVLQ